VSDLGPRDRLPREQGLGEPGPSIRAFTAAQRRALAGVLVIFLACLAVALVRNSSHVTDPMPAEAPRFDELADRLDPNVADVTSLSALPQLGARRARDIVEYRERMRAGDSSRIVYAKLEDLLRVRGIGAAMMKHVEPYLIFPATRPTTRSGTR
jgi:hypothetical protein